jgi:hypothetical protein
MNSSETTAFLVGCLSAHWVHPALPADPTTLGTHVRAWQRALNDVPLDLAERAVESLGRSTFRPTPMQVREAALRVAGVSFPPPPAVALADAMQALSHSPYEPFTHKWAHPLVKEALDTMGGVYTAFRENIPAGRAQFLRIYGDLAEAAAAETVKPETKAIAAAEAQRALPPPEVPPLPKHWREGDHVTEAGEHFDRHGRPVQDWEDWIRERPGFTPAHARNHHYDCVRGVPEDDDWEPSEEGRAAMERIAAGRAAARQAVRR